LCSDDTAKRQAKEIRSGKPGANLYNSAKPKSQSVNLGLELYVTRLVTYAVVLLVLGLTGCKVGWLIDRVAPDAIRDGKSYFEELRQRKVDQIVQSFDPGADKNSLRSDLGKVIALIPQQEPLGVETLGATAECKGSGVCTKLVTLEYRYPDRWILFQVTVSNRTGRYAITDLSIKPESMPLESINQFTLREKSWLHYAILLMALFSAGLAFYAFVLCIRTPIQKRKWLWIILTIIGFGKLGIEWSSGELWYKVLHISILPAGWGFDPDSPFMYVSIPAGAILFLLLRNHLRRMGTPALPITATPPTTSADQTESDSGQ
jgi:hypothetical protein